ncbi:MAG: extracellular solute-binding protein, partial [Lachnospiraceae bacterium]|nr:extracellular solute-binding protein [Lachnospiraceae bacterium]
MAEDGAYFLDMSNLQFSVNKDSKNLEMANEFMRFLITSEQLSAMAQKKGLMSPTKDLSLNSMYAAFEAVPQNRILSPEEFGLTDDAVVQLRQAIYGVATGTMTIDEAVAGYGSLSKDEEEKEAKGAGGSGSFTAPERKPLEEVTETGENTYTCTFDGVQHDFILDLPEQTENAPLIVMLHGYGQSAQTMRGIVKMEEKALPMGYAVVYVTGATNPTDSTSSTGWNSGVDDNPNDDVGLLAALVQYLQQEYSLSTDRVYAAGFSNGALMTHRLAMDGQDIFSAVASVAGKMTESVWERRYETNDIGVFQITGEKDELVPKNADGSAKRAIDPAIEDVMDYWAASNALSG